MPDTHVTVVGNLTDDPEVTFTPNGAAVTNFPPAVPARVKDGEGWRDGDTSFYRITAWRGLAEHIGDSLAKGNRVIVLGQLRSRSWETPEGERRTVGEGQAGEAGPPRPPPPQPVEALMQHRSSPTRPPTPTPQPSRPSPCTCDTAGGSPRVPTA